MTDRDILWLDQSEAQAFAQVGGKAAQLSRLLAHHCTPLGFCVTTAAYDRWLPALAPTMEPTTDREMRPLPEPLQAAIRDAYQELARRCGEEQLRVAVRSSAVGEDGQSASYAGQYESYLNRVGAPAVIEAVARCWAAGHSTRVQTYAQRQGKGGETLKMAVLVQQLVVADVALVAFSCNPITGRNDEVVINASWGLGESIVSGTVTPDTYIVQKHTGAIQEQIAAKEVMTILSNAGTREVMVPRVLQERATLTAAQVLAVAELAQALEQHMGWAVDIECAWQQNRLYLLQCRPVTTKR